MMLTASLIFPVVLVLVLVVSVPYCTFHNVARTLVFLLLLAFLQLLLHCCCQHPAVTGIPAIASIFAVTGITAVAVNSAHYGISAYYGISAHVDISAHDDISAVGVPAVV